ncbi:hypothetical protein TNCV_2789321 [Trichonephila clavipes]|nr:hypothetical protein TNCV_2789321 [Trichonephila clavipes]
MVFPYWWAWKETVGGANCWFRRSLEKSSPALCKQTISSSVIGRQESVSENSIRCACVEYVIKKIEMGTKVGACVGYRI